MTEEYAEDIKRVLLAPYYLFLAAVVAAVGMAINAAMEDGVLSMQVTAVRMGIKTPEGHVNAEGIDV